MSDLATRALRALDPETAHRLTIRALGLGLVPRVEPVREPVHMLGIDFVNRIGVAAGFDKNAEALHGLERLGFGHVEIGTVTPKPQPGNPRPRVFRLPEDRAIINRYGFNSEGFEPVHRRLERYRSRPSALVVGVNIGANKDSDDRVSDYASGVRRFSDVADYLTVNISSPNTPGLRALQAGDELRRLLDAVLDARASAERHRPILLKIAPDLASDDLDRLVVTVLESAIDGLVVSNTTLARPDDLSGRHRNETGGLSGAPLMGRSTDILARIRDRVGRSYPLIGVGGVTSHDDARAKRMAGADLVQLYTGLVFGGVRLARQLASRSLDEPT